MTLTLAGLGPERASSEAGESSNCRLQTLVMALFMDYYRQIFAMLTGLN